MARPTISIVLATHNRSAIVCATLQRLYALGSEVSGAEIIVVDNASTDGTVDQVRHRFPQVRLIARTDNRGSCAKAFGMNEAGGELIVALDDDSYPRPGTLARIGELFAEDSTLGAAGCRVHLPDGREESSALPGVFVGCGVGLRRSSLMDVGGWDPDLFMQAEEYDVAFRLARDGWGVKVDDQLHVDHLKTPAARLGRRTMYYDTRNNLLIASRYLPDDWSSIYRADWTRRYGWLARRNGAFGAYQRGRWIGHWKSLGQRRRYERYRLMGAHVEQFFRHRELFGHFDALRRQRIRRVVLADCGKNVFAFVAAARRAEIDVAAIADDCFAAPRRHYRGIPLLPTRTALTRRHDAVVIANMSPAHATRRLAALQAAGHDAVHAWYAFGAASGSHLPALV